MGELVSLHAEENAHLHALEFQSQGRKYTELKQDGSAINIWILRKIKGSRTMNEALQRLHVKKVKEHEECLRMTSATSHGRSSGLLSLPTRGSRTCKHILQALLQLCTQWCRGGLLEIGSSMQWAKAGSCTCWGRGETP